MLEGMDTAGRVWGWARVLGKPNPTLQAPILFKTVGSGSVCLSCVVRRMKATKIPQLGFKLKSRVWKCFPPPVLPNNSAKVFQNLI